LLAPAAIREGVEPLIEAGGRAVTGQVVAQGILSGIVALVAYGAAGSSLAAVVTSTAPAIATILAVPLLGETPPPRRSSVLP
jgi:drug/metabolite transporter (DMT)-like permease